MAKEVAPWVRGDRKQPSFPLRCESLVPLTFLRPPRAAPLRFHLGGTSQTTVYSFWSISARYILQSNTFCSHQCFLLQRRPTLSSFSRSNGLWP